MDEHELASNNPTMLLLTKLPIRPSNNTNDVAIPR